MKSVITALVVSAALSSGSVFAASTVPSGFDQTAPESVEAVLNNAHDGQIVTLKGRLVNFLGNDRYEFADKTGTIEIELDDDYDWSAISKDELIEITGEVDDDFLSTTIEVTHAVSLESGKSSFPLMHKK